MKATIDHEGKLIIEAETSLECYALRKWMGDHLAPVQDGEPCIRGGFFIDASEEAVRKALDARRYSIGMMTNA